MNVLGNGHWKLVTARNAENGDVCLLDFCGLELGNCALDEGVDYGFVPSGVDDCDAEW